jgi:hypothetical protein
VLSVEALLPGGFAQTLTMPVGKPLCAMFGSNISRLPIMDAGFRLGCFAVTFCSEWLAQYGMNYDEQLSVRQARELYFQKSGFDATSYSDKWARYRVGRLFTVLIPNTHARIKAAKLHDLHHIATGYETSWIGEAEISAWELASGGCGRYRIVWLFDTAALLLGCIINPKRVIRAFNRGIGSQNLFQQEFSETMLGQTVGSLKSGLRIKSESPM